MTDSIVADQLGSAYVITYAIEWLKRANWFPWLAQHTCAANRTISVIFALLVSVGFTFKAEGTMQTGGTITIGYPSMGVLISAALHFALQLGFHETLYQKVVRV